MSVLDRLATLVAGTAPDRRLRVAIDGVDGSGKTTLADALAAALQGRRPVVRASVDSFHRPRADRYRRGADSAEGCYLDTFDHQALRGRLLEPFARDGSYVPAVFDHSQDAVVDQPVVQADPAAALIVDGVFLQRPELVDCWDLAIHLRLPDEEVLRRVVVRDDGLPDDVEQRYRVRYLPAQRLYERESRPADRADVVLDNTDPAAPVVWKWPGPLG